MTRFLDALSRLLARTYGLDKLFPDPGHRTTDPACREHRTPRTWLERRRFDRARGLSCRRCIPPYVGGDQT